MKNTLQLAKLDMMTTFKRVTLITFEIRTYTLKTQQVDDSIKKTFRYLADTLGFCLVNEWKYVGSYFIENSLDIETVFSSVRNT